MPALPLLGLQEKPCLPLSPPTTTTTFAQPCSSAWQGLGQQELRELLHPQKKKRNREEKERRERKITKSVSHSVFHYPRCLVSQRHRESWWLAEHSLMELWGSGAGG